MVPFPGATSLARQSGFKFANGFLADVKSRGNPCARPAEHHPGVFELLTGNRHVLTSRSLFIVLGVEIVGNDRSIPAVLLFQQYAQAIRIEDHASAFKRGATDNPFEFPRCIYANSRK